MICEALSSASPVEKRIDAGGLNRFEANIPIIAQTQRACIQRPVRRGRFGVGTQHELSDIFFWGVAAEYLYGGTLDTTLQTKAPVALGGRGNVIGSNDDTGIIFVAGDVSWRF